MTNSKLAGAVGRPRTLSDDNRKRSYTVSLTHNRYKALIAKYGSLTAALASVQEDTGHA